MRHKVKCLWENAPVAVAVPERGRGAKRPIMDRKVWNTRRVINNKSNNNASISTVVHLGLFLGSLRRASPGNGPWKCARERSGGEFYENRKRKTSGVIVRQERVIQIMS